MPILKASQYPKGKFLKISNEHLRGRTLSWQAKGLLDFLLSYGEGYEHSFTGIMKHSKDGECAVRNTLKELETTKYLVRKMVNVPVNTPNSKGCRKKFEWIYIVSETPLNSDTFLNSPFDGFPHLETPHLETPHVETPYMETPHVENRNAYYKEVPYNEQPITTTTDNSSRSPSSGEGIVEKTEPSIVVFTELEEKVLAWAETQDYWRGLANDPARARAALAKSGPNCLVEQYKAKTGPVPSKSKAKVKDKGIDTCPYCDADGLLYFYSEKDRAATKPCKCDHNGQKIESFMATQSLVCESRKGIQSPQIEANEDEEVSLAMIVSMASKKATHYSKT